MSLIEVDSIQPYTADSVSILSNLKLQSVPAGTSINNLGIDASGLVVIGTSGGGGVFVTGGTYSNGTLDLIDSAGTLIPVTGFYTGGTFVESISDDGNGIVIVDNTDPLNPIVIFTGITTDGVTVSGTGLAGDPLTVIGGGSGVFLTGGTYSNGTLDLVDSNGTIIPVTGFYTGGTFVESVSSVVDSAISVDNTDPLNPILSFTGVTTDGVTVTGTGLAGDPLIASASSGVFVTGGTYSDGTLDLVDSSGAIIPVTGFYTGGTFVESVTSVIDGSISIDNTDPLNPILSFTGVTTDGVTVTGTGLAGSPLTVIGGGGSFTGGTINGATIFTNGLTANTITSNTITATTITSDKFYGDGSNLAGVVGLTYSDLGFTITSPTPTTINQDVVLPYNSDVTYPTELVIDNGYSVTIPSGTTLTIL
jgi:hypothetical protein